MTGDITKKEKINNLLKFRTKVKCNKKINCKSWELHFLRFFAFFQIAFNYENLDDSVNHKFGNIKKVPFVNDYIEHHKLSKSIHASPRTSHGSRSRCLKVNLSTLRLNSKIENEKIFTRLASNCMERDMQRLIHASMDHKKMLSIKSIIKNQNKVSHSISHSFTSDEQQYVSTKEESKSNPVHFESKLT